MNVKRTIYLLSTALTLSLTTALPAQTAGEQGKGPVTTLSVDARLVNIPVAVRDKKGAIVRGLGKADFSLEVDGRQQVIRYFDMDSNLPLVLGLLIDTSMSQREVLDEERTASGTFLDQMLKSSQDQAFIVQFAYQTELLTDLTNSRPKLREGLRQVDSPSPNDRGNTQSSGPDDSNGSSSDPGSAGGQGRRGGGTTLYDAAYLASDELMSRQKGRKALILLSDGVDNGSKENLAKSIESAQRADTIIYAIYFKGQEGGGRNPGGGGGHFPGGGGIGFPGGGYPGGPGGGGGGRGGPGGGPGGGGPSHVDGKKILERMTRETGGRLFEISKKHTIAQIYDEIGEELRSQYRLGCTPDTEAAADGYHQIDLTSGRKDLTIQTRDGYYTGK